ncbi:MAG: DUF4038 domain-containing protein [Clostridia bacterium]|nr:DUF4038 domain-containing protein [Clostridia bacterium]
MTVKTWLANELEFTSSKKYDNPFEDVDLDVTFVCGDTALTVPAFWDGGDTWRVRFALTKEGVWTYSTACTDKDNAGLSGTGEISCEKYDGDLEIYQRGFLKTIPNVRYFMYDDGKPFFYVGDTHWNMCSEEWDEGGEHAGDLECASHFKYLVDLRKEQGFNVYQSEPLGAGYEFLIGERLGENCIPGFQDLDRRFKYIADAGFVHANAQIIFPRFMSRSPRVFDVDYLKRLGRYWAARYSAYPCLWTLGQECDNNFYFERGDQKVFDKENNPFKFIAEGLHANDAYKHPLTAHMEFTRVETGNGMDGTIPSVSAFRDVEGHTWYGYQWSRDLGKPIDYEFAKDGYLNGQGKVCILYESRYDHLWTKEFGARSEGWEGILNGLFGYGYGAADIWCYKSTYHQHFDSNDGLETVTVEDKKIWWPEAAKLDSAYQVIYMKEFFEKLEWWKLVPRFDSAAYFISDKENYHSIATDERKTIVIYFANRGFETGKLTNLDKGNYTYQWFNPRTNEYLPEHPFVPDARRQYRIEEKPDKLDWTILIKKVD